MKLNAIMLMKNVFFIYGDIVICMIHERIINLVNNGNLVFSMRNKKRYKHFCGKSQCKSCDSFQFPTAYL